MISGRQGGPNHLHDIDKAEVKILNAFVQAYQNYASSPPTKSQKDAEIEIILETTRQLKTAACKRSSNFAEFASCLHRNRKLWTILAVDVADTANSLPDSLRAQIFYLSEFVQDYSRKVLQDDVSIEPLLDVNIAVLRGLGGKGTQK